MIIVIKEIVEQCHFIADLGLWRSIGSIVGISLTALALAIYKAMLMGYVGIIIWVGFTALALAIYEAMLMGSLGYIVGVGLAALALAVYEAMLVSIGNIVGVGLTALALAVYEEMHVSIVTAVTAQHIYRLAVCDPTVINVVVNDSVTVRHVKVGSLLTVIVIVKDKLSIF